MKGRAFAFLRRLRLQRFLRSPWSLLVGLAGVALVAAGAAIALTEGSGSASRETPLVEVEAQEDRPVTQDVRSLKAHNSPTIVQDPGDPNVFVVAHKIDEPRFGAALHVSDDRGRTWSPVNFPTPPQEDRPYAPDLAWAPDGTLHLVFVTLAGPGNNPEAVWITMSEDGGRTWVEPRKVLGPDAFQVRLAVDPVDGDLYLTWLQARKEALGTLSFTQTGLPILASRSSDGGKTWSEPARVSAPSRERVGAAVPTVAPAGDVYVLFYDFKEDRFDWENLEGTVYQGNFELVLARANADATEFEERIVEPNVVPQGRFLIYLPTFPAIALDEEDESIYVAWQDARHGDWDVLLRRSLDGGSTWSEPSRIHPPSNQDQYLPQLEVASDGRLDAVYVDRRDDPRNILSAMYFATSYDSGSSWSSLALSEELFDSRVANEGSRSDVGQGTRLGLVSTEAGADAVWTDARRGTAVSGRLDIFFGSARFTVE